MMTVIEKQYMEAVIAMNRRMQNKEIDWEQRRYEIARNVLVGCSDGRSQESAARWAVSYADALIAELKKDK